MIKAAQIKKTTVTIADVNVAQITALTATLDDGTQIAFNSNVSVGDWLVTDTTTGDVVVVPYTEFRSKEADFLPSPVSL